MHQTVRMTYGKYFVAFYKYYGLRKTKYMYDMINFSYVHFILVS